MSELFSLETARTGLYFAPRANLVETLHYGAKIRPAYQPLREKLSITYGSDVVYHTAAGEGDEPFALGHINTPLTPINKGDFRHLALELELVDGSRTVDFDFVCARTRDVPLPPVGLPAAHSGGETLVLDYTSRQGVGVRLIYTAYPDCDVITARMEISNTGERPFTLCKALSYQLDLPRTGYQLTTLTGAWARERHPNVQQLAHGAVTFGSNTGVSSHYCNPFFMLAEPDATEHTGHVYGFNLIYSGSHFASVESGPYHRTRVMAGIQPEGFRWTLQPGEKFDTPEAVLSYSCRGKNGLSQNMHRFVQKHIVRGVWANKPRPVLLNNWEATYFDFKESTLLRLAREAQKVGVELFVLDDGWFGQRNDDFKALGDYNINTKKLPGGLSGLAQKINALGMDFGLWVEPEMISPDSDLYRAHPDWAVHTPGQTPALGRNQLVLDLCRREVQDYIVENINKILHSAPIRYIKWDMNRHLSDCFSPALAEQGRFAHTWVQGVYRVFERVIAANPEVLFEACASGGNRFDLGILCYMPQIWTSDCTECWERMLIQTGTSYGYPPSVMGCHVSAVPNHQVLRTSPIEARFDVAAFGAFGYELDLTQCTPAEKKAIANQVAFYKQHRTLLQTGRFYRIASPFEGESCCWLVVDEEKKNAIVLDALGRVTPNDETPPLRLVGLDPDRCYRMENRPELIDIRCAGSLLNHVLPVKVNTTGLLVRTVAEHYMMPSETEQYDVCGDLLMYAGLRQLQRFTGTGYTDKVRMMPDYGARLYTLHAED